MAVHIIVLVRCLEGHSQWRARSAVALGGRVQGAATRTLKMSAVIYCSQKILNN